MHQVDSDINNLFVRCLRIYNDETTEAWIRFNDIIRFEACAYAGIDYTCLVTKDYVYFTKEKASDYVTNLMLAINEIRVIEQRKRTLC